MSRFNQGGDDDFLQQKIDQVDYDTATREQLLDHIYFLNQDIEKKKDKIQELTVFVSELREMLGNERLENQRLSYAHNESEDQLKKLKLNVIHSNNNNNSTNLLTVENAHNPQPTGLTLSPRYSKRVDKQSYAPLEDYLDSDFDTASEESEELDDEVFENKLLKNKVLELQEALTKSRQSHIDMDIGIKNMENEYSNQLNEEKHKVLQLVNSNKKLMSHIELNSIDKIDLPDLKSMDFDVDQLIQVTHTPQGPPEGPENGKFSTGIVKINPQINSPISEKKENLELRIKEQDKIIQELIKDKTNLLINVNNTIENLRNYIRNMNKKNL